MRKSNFSFDELTTCVNYALINGKFPITLKNANVTPVHKKDDPTDKINFRPVSVLPILSKVFERVIYNQLGKYMKLDNSGLVGAIVMDLSKAYDCLPHDLIIAKFVAYGLSKSSSSL